jgi:hypothetical protein
MGKKKAGEHGEEGTQEHASTPLNQLRDPASFGAPPKRSTFGASAGSSAQDATTAPIPGTRLTPSTGGLGAPLSRAQLEEDRRLAQERMEAQRREEEEPKVPVGPYKKDTTGLSTAHLPKPPVFRGAASPENAARSRPAPPSLPPRLPPRQATSPTSPPPAYSPTYGQQESGVLNQGAMSRLGAAGVKVSGLGIGGAGAPLMPSRTGTTSPPLPTRSPTTSAGPQLSELQSRFARLNSGSTPPPAPSGTTVAGGGGGGTSWAQKQAALKTASNFHKDPSSVSFSDAKNAASTANSFRDRHGEQVASGWKAAGGLNQKYGIADRFGGASPSVTPAVAEPTSPAGKKKPPPPPPAKRVGLQSTQQPPPINMGSKPSFP